MSYRTILPKVECIVSITLDNISNEERGPLSNAERTRNYRQGREDAQVRALSLNSDQVNFPSYDGYLSIVSAARRLGVLDQLEKRAALTSTERSRKYRQRRREARLKARESEAKFRSHDDISSASSAAHQSAASDEFEEPLRKKTPLTSTERARLYRERQKEAQRSLNVNIVQLSDGKSQSHDGGESVSSTTPLIFVRDEDGKLLGEQTSMTSAERAQTCFQRLEGARSDVLNVEHPDGNIPLIADVRTTSSAGPALGVSEPFPTKQFPPASADVIRKFRQEQDETRLKIREIRVSTAGIPFVVGVPTTSSAADGMMTLNVSEKPLEKRTPMSSAERTRRFRERQKEALSSTQNARQCSISMTNAERTRNYRQRLREARLNVQYVEEHGANVPLHDEAPSIAPVQLTPLASDGNAWGYCQTQSGAPVHAQNIQQPAANFRFYDSGPSKSSADALIFALDGFGEHLGEPGALTSIERVGEISRRQEEARSNAQDLPPPEVKIELPDDVASITPATHQSPVPKVKIELPDDEPSIAPVIYQYPVPEIKIEMPDDVPSIAPATHQSPVPEIKVEMPDDVPSIAPVTHQSPVPVIKIALPVDVPTIAPVAYQSPVPERLLPERRPMTVTEMVRELRRRQQEAQLNAQNVSRRDSEFGLLNNVPSMSSAGGVMSFSRSEGDSLLGFRNVQQCGANFHSSDNVLDTDPPEPLEFVLDDFEESPAARTAPTRVDEIHVLSVPEKPREKRIAMTSVERTRRYRQRQKEARLSMKNVQVPKPRIPLVVEVPTMSSAADEINNLSVSEEITALTSAERTRQYRQRQREARLNVKKVQVPKTRIPLVVEVPTMSSAADEIDTLSVSEEPSEKRTPLSSAERTRRFRQRQREARKREVQQSEASSQSYGNDSSTSSHEPLVFVFNALGEPSRRKAPMTSSERVRNFRQRQKERRLTTQDVQQSGGNFQVCNDAPSTSSAAYQNSAPVESDKPEEKRTPMTNSERSRNYRRRLKEAALIAQRVDELGANSASNDDVPSTSSVAHQISALVEIEKHPQKQTPMTNAVRTRNYRQRRREAQLNVQCEQQLAANSQLCDDSLLISSVPNQLPAPDGFGEHSKKRTPLTSTERARNHRRRQRESRLNSQCWSEFEADRPSHDDFPSTISAEHQVCAFDDFEEPLENRIKLPNSKTASYFRKRQRGA